jgi:hypothetical protein
LRGNRRTKRVLLTVGGSIAYERIYTQSMG